MNTARSQDPPAYTANDFLTPDQVKVIDDTTINQAKAILTARLRAPGAALDHPQTVKDLLILRMSQLEVEHFDVLFLTSHHSVIAIETVFTGTLTQTAVYPREIVRAALRHNCGAVILAHNHPSGSVEPSRADEFLTQTLKAALALVDVRVLDHVIVAGVSTLSFAEKGLL